MSKRVAIGKKARFEVFKRDGFRCIYCGNSPPKVLLHVDHVHPVCKGGDNDADNLVTACDACNLGKGGIELSAIPPTIEEKTTILREREEQVAAFNEAVLEKQQRREDTIWEVANVFLRDWNETAFRRDWFASISYFSDRLDLEQLVDAAWSSIEKGFSKDRTFRYFCGICWRLIREEDGQQ